MIYPLGRYFRMLKDELDNCVSVLATPSDAYSKIRISSRWAVPLSLNSLMYLIVSLLMMGVFRQMMSNIYAARFGADSVNTLVSGISMASFALILVFQAVAIPVRWIAVSSVVRIASREVPFRSILSSLLYAEIVLSLMSLTNVLLIYARGIEKVSGPSDLDLVPGLQYIVSDAANERIRYVLAQSVNLFSVWYVVTFAIGLTRLCDIPRSRSLALSCLTWTGWSLLVALWPQIQSGLSSAIGLQ
ncbi:MAG TPA: hypothetical protein VMM57_06385 [Bacteroidota bacterium]|nr:hypothetical protein [Bacteroidota bacterium]